jgi:threonine/homoserine/homoserine lactone efflux protein
VPSTDAVLAFAAASFVLFLIPGPAVAYIVNRSVADGRASALVSVAGLTVGNVAHVVAAAAGLSAVLAASATAFTIVKWSGATYLVGVGVRTLLTRPAALVTDAPSMTHAKAFRQGVIVNTLNPKVALFFLSFLPQFIDTGRGAAWSQALALGALFAALGWVMDSSRAVLASGLRSLLVRGRAQAIVRRWVSGSLFVGLGVIAARAHGA